MVDIEKLRKGLEYCPGIVHCSDYGMEKDCPYGYEDCIEKMDDITTLKELEWMKKIMVVDKMFGIDNLYALAKAVNDGYVEIHHSVDQREQRLIIKQL